MTESLDRRTEDELVPADPDATVDDGAVDPLITEPTGAAGSRVPRDPTRRLLLVAVLLAAVAGSLVMLSVANAPRLSLLDESTHVDYTWRVAHGDLPRTGQPFSDFTLQQWACRGQSRVPLPPCGSDTPASGYPNAGVQYNAFHPPTYYAVTGIAARALSWATGVDFLNSARAFGAVWLFAAMLGMYLTLRYWHVEWGYAVAGALALPLVPTVLHASSIVTNDAPTALAGVAALFVLGRVAIYRNTGWILPVAFAGLAASTKVMNAMALLVVAGIMVVLALRRSRTEGFRPVVPLLRTAALMVAAVGVVYVGWDLVQSGRTTPDFTSPIAGDSTKMVEGLPFDEWLPTLVEGLPLGNNYYLDPEVNHRYVAPWVTVLSTLMAVTSFVAMATFRKWEPRWVAGATLLVGCVAYPLVVQLQAIQGSNNYFPTVPTRYGLSLLPLGAGVLMMLAARWDLRRTTIALLGCGGLAMVTASAGLA